MDSAPPKICPKISVKISVKISPEFQSVFPMEVHASDFLWFYLYLQGTLFLKIQGNIPETLGLLDSKR